MEAGIRPDGRQHARERRRGGFKKILEFDSEAVVAMASSVASRQAVETSLEYGASYYIRKDTRKDEVIEKLNSFIEDIWEGGDDE